MIKILGFIIIVVSSAKIGFDLSEKYSNRTRELKALINVFERVKNEISFSNCVISDALINSCNVKSKNISYMIKFVSDAVSKKSITLADAFNSYIKMDNTLSLNNKDIEEINSFFSMFGSGDREDEIKNINNSISNIKSNLQAAIDDEKRYVKLFRTSGVLAGFLIAIILA